jgi:hypothetical protein
MALISWCLLDKVEAVRGGNLTRGNGQARANRDQRIDANSIVLRVSNVLVTL